MKTIGGAWRSARAAVAFGGMAAGLAAAGSAPAQMAIPTGAPADGCAADGQTRYICGQAGPEDLLQVPGTPWVIASSYQKQGLKLIDSRTLTSTALFPAADAQTRFDARAFPDCPGPLSAAELGALNTHGLAIARAGKGVFTLYAIHHGERETVEVFDLDTVRKVPRVTWRGCIVAPMPLGINSMVMLREGGFLVSNFRQRGPEADQARALIAAGKPNGELWEWHAGKGFAKVPGTEASGPNGVELSRDGKWLFMAAWGGQSIERISRGKGPARRVSVPVGFKIDNLRRGPDGQIYGGGQTADRGSRVVRIDPETLKVTVLFAEPPTAKFGYATVGIPVGRQLWIGSAYGDRIALLPLP